uniref:Uncharacterized protein n=1 Tax=Rhizophora mucronata TaxID=61149 RepID=A0A2P2IS92_RHIMU
MIFRGKICTTHDCKVNMIVSFLLKEAMADTLGLDHFY